MIFEELIEINNCASSPGRKQAGTGGNNVHHARVQFLFIFTALCSTAPFTVSRCITCLLESCDSCLHQLPLENPFFLQIIGQLMG